MKKLTAVLETRSFDLMNTFFSPFRVDNIKLYSQHEPNIWLIKGKLGFIESCNPLNRPMPCVVKSQETLKKFLSLRVWPDCSYHLHCSTPQSETTENN